MSATLSLDLRQRIVRACDHHEGTRAEIAARHGVSLGMVKKLLAQRARTGDLRDRYRLCGREPKLVPTYGPRLRALLAAEPGLTLAAIRDRLDMPCTVAAVHWTLKRLNLATERARRRPAQASSSRSPRPRSRKIAAV